MPKVKGERKCKAWEKKAVVPPPSSGMLEMNDDMKLELGMDLGCLKAELDEERRIPAIVTGVKRKRFPYFGFAVSYNGTFLKMIVIIEDPAKFQANGSKLKVKFCERKLRDKSSGARATGLSTLSITDADSNNVREGANVINLLDSIVDELQPNTKRPSPSEGLDQQGEGWAPLANELKPKETEERKGNAADPCRTDQRFHRQPKRINYGIVQTLATRLYPGKVSLRDLSHISDGFKSFRSFDWAFEEEAQTLHEQSLAREKEECEITRHVIDLKRVQETLVLSRYPEWGPEGHWDQHTRRLSQLMTSQVKPTR